MKKSRKPSNVRWIQERWIHSLASVQSSASDDVQCNSNIQCNHKATNPKTLDSLDIMTTLGSPVFPNAHSGEARARIPPFIDNLIDFFAKHFVSTNENVVYHWDPAIVGHNTGQPAWAHFSYSLAKIIEILIRLAQHVEGFIDLKPELQLDLMKKNIFEAVIFSQTPNSDIISGQLSFTGYKLSNDCATEQHLTSEIYDCIRFIAEKRFTQRILATACVIVLLESAFSSSRLQKSIGVLYATLPADIAEQLAEIRVKTSAVSRTHKTRLALLRANDSNVEDSLHPLYRQVFIEQPVKVVQMKCYHGINSSLAPRNVRKYINVMKIL
ncbi:hypothetical protein QR680_015223 [Steinernema hermaphroditum]|uniref:NR LBD domain-containing protein n=1 Tax=Steinernema hermaphroditum TaxID=289476 RepID=A0AA39ID17_9BILA|nr:hypothetical protein QR680_015223 [Steinernema hermaphroditum]